MRVMLTMVGAVMLAGSVAMVGHRRKSVVLLFCLLGTIFMLGALYG